MEIWIRSQNKGFLMLVTHFSVSDERVMTYAYDETRVPLGTYNSEAEALQVLDDIQGYINYYFSQKEPVHVYQMPEAGFCKEG